MISFATWMTMAHMGHRRTQSSKIPGLRLKEVKCQNIWSHIWRKIGHLKEIYAENTTKNKQLGIVVLLEKNHLAKNWFDVDFPCFCKIWMSRKPIHVMVMVEKTKTIRSEISTLRDGEVRHKSLNPGKRLTEGWQVWTKKTAWHWMLGEKCLKSMNHIGWNFLEYDMCLTV